MPLFPTPTVVCGLQSQLFWSQKWDATVLDVTGVVRVVRRSSQVTQGRRTVTSTSSGKCPLFIAEPSKLHVRPSRFS